MEKQAIEDWIRSRQGKEAFSFDGIAKRYVETWTELNKVESEWHPASVSKGTHEHTRIDNTARGATYVATLPPKLLVLAGFAGAGGEMWDVMTRHTQVMFHHEESFRPGVGNEKFKASKRHYSEADLDVALSDSTGIGAMSVFFRVLEKRQRDNDDCDDITLVGHSMGEMVINEGLLEFPHVRCKRVVYMAGAGSIHEFASGTLPYLDLPEHRNVELFRLSLHPRAEDRERSLGDSGTGILAGELVPRGSLLVWIDEFLGRPKSFTDRTVGHFENTVLASRILPPRLQERVHLTALSVGPGKDANGQPKQGALQHHGDFSDYRFWNPKFYQLDGAENRNCFLVDKPEVKQLAERFGTPTAPGEGSGLAAAPGKGAARRKATRRIRFAADEQPLTRQEDG